MLANHAVTGFAIETSRLCVRLALLAAIFVPLERFFALHPAKLFYRGWAVDLGYYFLNALTPIFLLAPAAALLGQGLHLILPYRVLHLTDGWSFWTRAAAAVVVGEIGYYWGHRFSHEIPLLWRFHAVHHSAEHLGFLVNTRAHPLDLVFARLCMLTPLTALGLGFPGGANAGLPAVVLLFGLTWSYFIHANVRWRLGPLEHLVATPAFHHWHHTKLNHVNRNYSTLLPLIDRFFGTFYLPHSWPEAYGTRTPVASSIPGQVLLPPIDSAAAARSESLVIDVSVPGQADRTQA